MERTDSTDSTDVLTHEDSLLIYPLCIPERSLVGIGSCGLMFYKTIIRDSLLLSIAIDPEQITITNTCQYFTLPHPGISILMEQSKGYPDSLYFNYCNDVIYGNEGIPFKYKCSSGSLSIASDIDTLRSDSHHIHVSTELSDLYFQFNEADTTFQHVIFYKVLLGFWPPG